MQSDIVQRLEEWGGLPSSVEFLDSVEAIFDPGNRHKSGAAPTDYLASWISMLRPYAYATADGSWGELEKLLCIVMRNYVQVRRDAVTASAEITRLTEALRKAEEREKALREALESAADYLGRQEFTEDGHSIYLDARAALRENPHADA